MSEETVVADRVLISEAAARWLKAGYRIESETDGIMVLVAKKITLPWVGPLILSILTFGIFFVIWMGLLMLPRVNRKTITVENGVAVTVSSWRYA